MTNKQRHLEQLEYGMDIVMNGYGYDVLKEEGDFQLCKTEAGVVSPLYFVTEFGFIVEGRAFTELKEAEELFEKSLIQE